MQHASGTEEAAGADGGGAGAGWERREGGREDGRAGVAEALATRAAERVCAQARRVLARQRVSWDEFAPPTLQRGGGGGAWREQRGASDESDGAGVSGGERAAAWWGEEGGEEGPVAAARGPSSQAAARTPGRSNAEVGPRLGRGAWAGGRRCGGGEVDESEEDVWGASASRGGSEDQWTEGVSGSEWEGSTAGSGDESGSQEEERPGGGSWAGREQGGGGGAAGPELITSILSNLTHALGRMQPDAASQEQVSLSLLLSTPPFPLSVSLSLCPSVPPSLPASFSPSLSLPPAFPPSLPLSLSMHLWRQSAACDGDPKSYTPNPEPRTPTQTSTPQFPNPTPTPYTLHPDPQTVNPKPQT